MYRQNMRQVKQCKAARAWKELETAERAEQSIFFLLSTVFWKMIQIAIESGKEIFKCIRLSCCIKPPIFPSRIKIGRLKVEWHIAI